jgi:RNA polymerase sigma factor (sigma-70 family)
MAGALRRRGCRGELHKRDHPHCGCAAMRADWPSPARSAMSANSTRFMEKASSIGEDDPRLETNPTLADRSRILRGALARFFQRHVHDSDEADDLVQEVFLRIVRRGDTADIEHLDGYIFETASNVLRDRSRRRKARLADRHVPFDLDRHDIAELGPERALLGREGLNAAGVALLELPERTRRTFILRRLEGLSYREIGRRLGVSVSAIEKHMQRAVRHLAARTGEST